MHRYPRLTILTPLLALVGCASTGASSEHAPDDGHAASPPSAAAGIAHPADVRFMQEMLGHHAQALVMAAMAPSHGASPHVLRLVEKIEISQRDEMNLMRQWLEERRQPVPDAAHMHHTAMPGMLTAEQMSQLDAARGAGFDRLFLRFMIQHHRGALEMVDTLFASPGAAQDPDIFRFATDVAADQMDEIHQMQAVLDRSRAP